jgi:cytochrome o ubiquinol oxidase subunit 2
MNSFWIPQLGGQIYAMSGMSTHLHLSADAVGNFNGSSANISGRGFSGMKFIARSSTQAEYESWLAFVRGSTKALNLAEYSKLAKPSENNLETYYGSTQKDLFASVVTKYTHPSRISAAQVPTLGRQ